MKHNNVKVNNQRIEIDDNTSEDKVPLSPKVVKSDDNVDIALSKGGKIKITLETMMKLSPSGKKSNCDTLSHENELFKDPSTDGLHRDLDYFKSSGNLDIKVGSTANVAL